VDHDARDHGGCDEGKPRQEQDAGVQPEATEPPSELETHDTDLVKTLAADPGDSAIATGSAAVHA
jgi:hypothetical protein